MSDNLHVMEFAQQAVRDEIAQAYGMPKGLSTADLILRFDRRGEAAEARIRELRAELEQLKAHEDMGR